MIIAILAAVLFTLFLLVLANTMAQAVRERTSELAVLKTLGFSNGLILALVLGESMFLALIGGGLGLAVTYFAVGRGSFNNALLPVFIMRNRDVVIGLAALLRARHRRRCASGDDRDAAAHHRRAAEDLTMLRWLSQTLTVSALSVRTIPQRLSSSAVAVIGIAGVVIVFVAVLSIGEGFKAAMADAGSPSRAIVMRSGADSEMTSGFPGDRGRHHQAGAGAQARRAIARSRRRSCT